MLIAVNPLGNSVSDATSAITDIYIQALVTEFVAYFERTWLVGNNPPVVWNMYETQHTNNRLEGRHSEQSGRKSPP